ncbi:MAG: substrate-binding domain-containing protein [Pseudomonadota bacterium]
MSWGPSSGRSPEASPVRVRSGEALVDGSVELGVQQVCELPLTPGITVVGPLPDALRKHSVATGAVSPRAQSPQAGLQFLDFLATPFARQALRDSGLALPGDV